MCHLSVSLVPNLGKMLQSPQRDLAPWTLTLTITDWLSLYFLFYNKPHCWKENVSQGQRFSGRIQKEETFQKHMHERNGIWFENCSNLLWDKNCSSDRKNILQIIYLEPRIFEKFFWIPKTVMKGQHTFWNRSDTGRIHWNN